MKKNCKALILILILSIFSSCESLLNNPSDQVEEDEPTIEPEIQPVSENEVSMVEMEIFPEKRRLRQFGFRSDLSTGNIDDLDGDGFLNSDDPYPLDKSYPGIVLSSIGDESITCQISSDLEDVDYYMNQFKKDISSMKRLIDENDYDSSKDNGSDNDYLEVYINGTNTDTQSDYDHELTLTYKIPFYNIASSEITIMNGNTADFDIEISGTVYENPVITYNLDNLSGKQTTLDITLINKSTSIETCKIKVEGEYFSDIFDESTLNSFNDYVNNSSGEYWSAIDFADLDDTDNSLWFLNSKNNFTLYNNNDFKLTEVTISNDESYMNYDENYVNTTTEDYLKRFITNTNQILFNFYDDLDSSIDINLDNVVVRLLTDEDVRLSKIVNDGSDTHLNLTEINNLLNLPNDYLKWGTLPYEKLYITSFFRYQDSDNINAIKSRDIFVDNIVLKNISGVDKPNYSQMKISIPEHDAPLIDIENIVFLKLVQSRDGIQNGNESYDRRLFINFGNGYYKHIEGTVFNDEFIVDVFGIAESGLTVEYDDSEDLVHLTYNLDSDKGLLPQLLYTNRDSEYDDSKSSSLDKDSYVLFFFLLPLKNQKGFIILGTPVHFWGPPPRDTLIAKYSDGSITDTKLIPYEKFLDDNFDVEQLYFHDGTQLYDDDSDNRFNLETDDKLIILHGSTLLDEPEVDSAKVKVHAADETFNLTISDEIAEDISTALDSNIKTHAFISAYDPVVNIVNFNDLPKSHYSDYSTIELSYKNYTSKDNYHSSKATHNAIGKITIDLNNKVVYENFTTSISTDISHWIPNTDEMTEAFEIDAYIENSITGEEDDFLNKVEFLSPVDPNWSNVVSSNNVNANKGDGFEIYAILDNGDLRLITTFNNLSRVAEDQASYSVTNHYTEDDNLFVSGGKVKFRNGIEGDYTTSFCIKAIGNIRPGDDILLRFKGYINHQELIDTLPEEDFFAVYDKKMLWRANLYIDEGDAYNPTTDINNPENFTDWNNRNPWDSDDNEWNLVHDGEGNNNFDNITDLDDGNGGQTVRITPFTWHNHDINTPGTEIENSVSYSVGAQDDPFTFNKNMLDQQPDTTPSIWESYTDDVYIPGYSSYLWLTQRRIRQRSYSVTLEQRNTILVGIESGEIDGENEEVIQSITPTVDTTLENCNPDDLADRLQHYRGQLTAEQLQTTQLTQHRDFTWWYESAQSAGVDCVGFVHRAAAYEGNNYYIANLNAMEWIHTPDPMPGNPNNEPDDVWGMISDGATPRRNLTVDWEGDDKPPTLWEITRHDEPLNELQKVVPGDIMYYWNRGAYHVTIINEVNSTDNDISLDEVELIEATWNDREGKVFNMKDLEDYQNRDWIIGRLLIN